MEEERLHGNFSRIGGNYVHATMMSLLLAMYCHNIIKAPRQLGLFLYLLTGVKTLF